MLTEDDEIEVRQLYGRAYQKRTEAIVEGKDLEAAYYQGKKDAFRAVLAELCADENSRTNFRLLNETTPSSPVSS